MTAGTLPARSAGVAACLRFWPLILGLAVLAVPTMATLGREVWSREIGAHGPIVLATGLWLLVSARQVVAQGVPGPAWQQAAIAVPSLLVYVFGRAYDFISLEAAGLYGVFIASALGLIGWRAMATIWFPLFYMAFLVPPPGWLLDRITAPLRMFISYVVAEGLGAFGLPIARDGVTMTIAQYRLLVEDACSGMNSIIGLTAITLLYIYLMHRASWRYAALLALTILPIAIIANMIRVTLLVLLTYHYGDAVAQGFLHMTAGMALFMLALLLIFAIDALFQRTLKPAA